MPWKMLVLLSLGRYVILSSNSLNICFQLVVFINNCKIVKFDFVSGSQTFVKRLLFSPFLLQIFENVSFLSLLVKNKANGLL